MKTKPIKKPCPCCQQDKVIAVLRYPTGEPRCIDCLHARGLPERGVLDSMGSGQNVSDAIVERWRGILEDDHGMTG